MSCTLLKKQNPVSQFHHKSIYISSSFLKGGSAHHEEESFVLEPTGSQSFPSLCLTSFAVVRRILQCVYACVHARVLFLYARIYQFSHDRICVSGLQTLLLHIRNLLYLFGERFILMFQSQPTLPTGFQTLETAKNQQKECLFNGLHFVMILIQEYLKF